MNLPIVQGSQQNKRQAIQNYEDALRKLPQAVLDVFHHFSAGVYLRELRIPADTHLTGKIHRYPCLNIVVQGEIEVATDKGNKRIVAPAIFESPPGTKRAGYTITDTIWITAHSFPEDLEKTDEAMNKYFTASSFEELENLTERLEA